MNKNDYTVEVENFITNNLGEFVDITDTKKRYKYCPLSCNGYSKNKTPHLDIEFNDGFYYCYRCQDGGILYNLIKLFKTDSNKEYVNNLLKLYFDHYEYEHLGNEKSKNSDHIGYNFTSKNIQIDSTTETFSELQFSFLKKRFPTLEKDDIIKLTKEFNLILPKSGNYIYFLSYFMKAIYGYYLLKDGHRKLKRYNDKILNDKKDYYFKYKSSKNLFISEGLFDLITLNITDPLYNKNESSYLALCSKNTRNIFEFLLCTGTFYYDNVFLVVDNDVTDTFVKTFYKNTNRSNVKYKIFKNFYTIKAPKNFVDVNEYYMKEKNCDDLMMYKLI